MEGMVGRDMVGAALAVYGPRTTIIVFNDKLDTPQEFTLKEGDNDEEFWILTKDKIDVAYSTRIFAPMNSRAIVDNIAYRNCIDFWIKTGYSLRYSGALSADSYHLLTKGEGVYTSIGSKTMKCKLRLLYELTPVSFLVEKAGGKSTDGEQSILDIPIDGWYQKSSITVGSTEEVERMERFNVAFKEQQAQEDKALGNSKNQSSLSIKRMKSEA
jgi:sedoheptulose-bisphosphatase